jgi:hypothetical protein
MTELHILLADLRPEDSLAKRHVWLIRLFEWLHAEASSTVLVAQRLRVVLDALEADPDLRGQERRSVGALVSSRTSLLAAKMAEVDRIDALDIGH